VPLETRAPASYVLVFDNTNGLTTGVALANASGTPAKVSVIIRDDTGTQIGTDTISFSGHGHTSFLLPSKYAFAGNKRGMVEFVVPQGGLALVLCMTPHPVTRTAKILLLSKPDSVAI